MDAFSYDSARFDELELVDVLDREVGAATKEQVHARGLLHRAFSVVLTRERRGECEVLLARRAMTKYHAGGLWGNSCCSHPRVGETVMQAASRRVGEELGVTASALDEIGSFVYRAEFDNNLVEYEYDHVLVGTCCSDVSPNLDEVDAFWWMSARELSCVLRDQPQSFAPWALTVLPMALASMEYNTVQLL